MKYLVVTSDGVKKVLKKWKRSNPILLKKFQQIYHELAEHPREGIGHPEPLKGSNCITYSRRVSAKDRVVYDIYEEKIVVMVLAVEGHYNDK